MYDRPANNTVSWELTESWNLGLDFGLFNNRLMISADAYRKSTEDIAVDLSHQQYLGLDSISSTMQLPSKDMDMSWASVLKLSEAKYFGIGHQRSIFLTTPMKLQIAVLKNQQLPCW